MATTVTVLCPNGRRVSIKATPTVALMQVLEQACAKQKLDPNMHALKHHSKLLDLNSLFRYSNLSQNAKLEMVTIDRPRTEASEVVLAVQCEDGSRVQGKFNPTSTSLWGVISQLGVVTEDGVGRFEPVVVYMNNQICGENSLKEKSLRELGLASGRSVVRLLFRDRQSEPSAETKSQSSQTLQTSNQDQIKADGKDSVTEVPMEQETIATEESSTSDQKCPELRTDSDDEQPRSKLKGPTYRKRPAAPRENLDSTSHTEHSTGMTLEDSDTPYFPAHPISIFPQDDPLSKQELEVQQVSQFMQHPLTSQTISSTTVHVPTLQPFMFPEVALAQVDNQPLSKLQSKPRQQPVRVYDEPCDRETVVYHVDNALPVTPSEELPEGFFNVTVRDVRLMYSDFKKQTSETADAPLLTQDMRKTAKGRRYDHYDVAVIRVHLPDQWILQGCFRPNESLKAIVKFVREHLADPQLKFHLYTAPPKNILRSARLTLFEAGFVPAAIIYLGLDSTDDVQTPLLSDKALESAQSALQAEIIMVRKRDQKSPKGAQMTTAGNKPNVPSGPLSSVTSQPNTSNISTASVSGSSGRTAGATGGGEGARKVPKWFKVGK